MKQIDAAGKVIFICDGKKCGKYSKEIRKGFKEAIKENGLKNKVQLIEMDCSGNCKCAPVLCLQPQNVWIGEISRKDIATVLDKLIK